VALLVVSPLTFFSSQEETIHQFLVEQADGVNTAASAGWTRQFVMDLKAQARPFLSFSSCSALLVLSMPPS
jgi:hypothetical protein